MNQNSEILMVVVPLELKDAVVDILMAIESLSGFNIKPIQGFSRRHAAFSSKEKVQGFKDFAQFEVLVDEETKPIVFETLQPLCSANEVKYWCLSVSESGHFAS